MKRVPALDGFRDLGAEASVLHRGTQCSMALSKSCSQRRSTNSRTDRFFSGNSRQSKSKEPGGTTTPLPVPSDDCGGSAVGSDPCSDLAAFSSLAKKQFWRKTKNKTPPPPKHNIELNLNRGHLQIRAHKYGTRRSVQIALHSIELKYPIIFKTCFFNFFFKGTKIALPAFRRFFFLL